MIVVMVYRPEAIDYPFSYHAVHPFDGVEILGIYEDSREDSVNEMIDVLRIAHPHWQFHYSNEEQMTPEETMIIASA